MGESRKGVTAANGVPPFSPPVSPSWESGRWGARGSMARHPHPRLMQVPGTATDLALAGTRAALQPLLHDIYLLPVVDKFIRLLLRLWQCQVEPDSVVGDRGGYRHRLMRWWLPSPIIEMAATVVD